MKSPSQKWNEANRDKVHTTQKRYRTKHRALVTERTRLWANTEDGMKSCRNSQFKRKYGITLDQYDAMLEKQNHQCAICDRKNGVDNRRLFVEHCHKTKVIRGLVCYRCNSGLASFGDSLDTIKRAVVYLQAIAKAEGRV